MPQAATPATASARKAMLRHAMATVGVSGRTAEIEASAGTVRTATGVAVEAVASAAVVEAASREIEGRVVIAEIGASAGTVVIAATVRGATVLTVATAIAATVVVIAAATVAANAASGTERI
jgi:hypothetical protein